MTLKGFNNEALLEMYRTMETIRQFEWKSVELFKAGELAGFLHLYIGEEAVATGVCSLLNKDDYITSTHRGHGHIIAKGAEMNKMMAELFGKVTGYCRGKGGSMHIMDRNLGILGANGIVGGGIPIATGAALSSKLRKSKQVTVCFFGDGASNQGSFHEALNFASVFKLPIVYVCENNLYADSTPQKHHQNIKDISVRAKSYDIFSDTVDGNDVIEVYNKAKIAVERARNGEGPTLIEAKTYRWLGHSIGDAGVYRTKEEVEEWKLKDPIVRFKKLLLENKIATEKEFNEISKTIEADLEKAVEYGRSSEEPALEVALQDVFA